MEPVNTYNYHTLVLMINIQINTHIYITIGTTIIIITIYIRLNNSIFIIKEKLIKLNILYSTITIIDKMIQMIQLTTKTTKI